MNSVLPGQVSKTRVLSQGSVLGSARRIAAEVANLHGAGRTCRDLTWETIHLRPNGGIEIESEPGGDMGRDVRAFGQILDSLLPTDRDEVAELIRRCQGSDCPPIRDMNTILLMLDDSVVREGQRRATFWKNFMMWLAMTGASFLTLIFVPGLITTPDPDGIMMAGVGAIYSAIPLQERSQRTGAMPLLSSDGRLLVVLDGDETTNRHRVHALDTGESWWLDDLPADATMASFSPGGRELLFFAHDELQETTALWIIPVAGGKPRRLASTGEHRSASWGPDGSVVFGTYVRGGLASISAGGGDIVPLTELDRSRGEFTHRWPHHLPGGQGVLFAAELEDRQNWDKASICVHDLRSGKVKVLLEGGTLPAFLPPDRLVYFRAGQLMAIQFDPERLAVSGSPVRVLDGVEASNWIDSIYSLALDGTLAWGNVTAGETTTDLVWIDRQGQEKPVFPLFNGQIFASVELSPDDSRFMVKVDRDLWVGDLANDRSARFTTQGGAQARWTPDGEHAAYFHWSGDEADIWWAPIDGSAPAEPLLSEPGGQVPDGFSPDGELLLYTTELPEGGIALQIWNISEKETHSLPATQGADEGARLSPDGNWIALTFGEGSELRLVSFPDGNITYTAATGNIQTPRWSQRSDLYFLNGALHVIEDVSARIASGKELTPRILLPEGVLDADYDVTWDGERFITIRKHTAEFDARVNLILNWKAAPETARVTPR